MTQGPFEMAFQTGARSGYDSPGGRGPQPSENRLARRHQRTRAMTFSIRNRAAFTKRQWPRPTPTLAIVVEREAKIKKFVPRDYWEGHRHIQSRGRRIHRQMFDEKFVSGLEGWRSRSQTDRLWEVSRAESLPR